jgi:hypothetical protein
MRLFTVPDSNALDIEATPSEKACHSVKYSRLVLY